MSDGVESGYIVLEAVHFFGAVRTPTEFWPEAEVDRYVTGTMIRVQKVPSCSIAEFPSSQSPLSSSVLNSVEFTSNPHRQT